MLTQGVILQVSHWVIEDQERVRLVEQYLGIIERVAFALAERLYSEYVEQLLVLLNSTVCPEEPYVFATTPQLQQCQWELKSQLRRVASPIIQATLRWSHLNTRARQGAAEEMIYVLPWVAVKMATSGEEHAEVPILGALLREHAPPCAASARGAIRRPGRLRCAAGGARMDLWLRTKAERVRDINEVQ
jgi:hypothetical protein